MGRLLRNSLLIAIAIAPVQVAVADEVEKGNWKPRVKAAQRYAKQRAGDVRFAVIGPRGGVKGLDAKRTAPTASLLKAMLLVAYLRQDSVRHRSLGPDDRGLLRPMIRSSDNAAASAVNAIIGSRIYRVAGAAHMRDFHWQPDPWGTSRSSPRDQARFFYRLRRLVPRRHRNFALRQLGHIVPGQRWGVGRVPHRGWRLYFKGGWGSGTGWVDHQAALLRRGKRRIGLAIFTESNPSHAYGKQTLRGVARRLLRGLPR